MSITDAILTYLKNRPDGATTEELWKYAKQMGCIYEAEDEKKSTSGICSKLCKSPNSALCSRPKSVNIYQIH